MTEDERIIALLTERDEYGLTVLSEKYGITCKRIAENILHNALDAEECVDDAYLALWSRIPPEKPAPLRSYLFRVVRNLATARYHANTAEKRNSHYDVALEELEDCIAAPGGLEEELAAAELSRQINCFLERLDRRDRALFVRRYWYSDSVSALAERFQMSQNNVSVRLSRLREKLKKHLTREGFEL